MWLVLGFLLVIRFVFLTVFVFLSVTDRVVGSKFDRSDDKKEGIRREQLVVRFDSIYVTDENTNYLSAVNPRPRRLSRRQKLLSTVEMSGSCPTAHQTASGRFPLSF